MGTIEKRDAQAGAESPRMFIHLAPHENVQILRMHAEPDQWLRRRVEAVEFRSERVVRRRTSLDFDIPKDRRQLDGHGRLLMPFALLEKKELTAFDLWCDGAAVTLLNKAENKAIVTGAFVQWLEEWHMRRKKVPDALRGAIGDFVEYRRPTVGDAHAAGAAAAESRPFGEHVKSPRLEAVAEKVEEWAGRGITEERLETLYAALADFEDGYLAIAAIPGGRPHGVLKFSYDEVSPDFGVGIGWSDIPLEIKVYGVSAGGSCHFEITLPDGVTARELNLYRKVREWPPQDPGRLRGWLMHFVKGQGATGNRLGGTTPGESTTAERGRLRTWLAKRIERLRTRLVDRLEPASVIEYETVWVGEHLCGRVHIYAGHQKVEGGAHPPVTEKPGTKVTLQFWPVPTLPGYPVLAASMVTGVAMMMRAGSTRLPELLTVDDGTVAQLLAVVGLAAVVLLGRAEHAALKRMLRILRVLAWTPLLLLFVLAGSLLVTDDLSVLTDLWSALTTLALSCAAALWLSVIVSTQQGGAALRTLRRFDMSRRRPAPGDNVGTPAQTLDPQHDHENR